MDSKQLLVYLLVIVSKVTVLSGCNYSFDNYVALPSSAHTLDVANLTIETSNTAEVSNGVFRLMTNGTADYGCTYNSGASNDQYTGTSITSPDSISSLTDREAVFFTAPSYMNTSAVKIRIRKYADPGGAIAVTINDASAGIPGTNILSQASEVLLSSFGTTAAGVVSTYTFPTNLVLASGTQIAAVIQPGTGASFPANNYYRLTTTNDNTGTACSAFSIYKLSSDSGSTWGDSNNLTYRRGYATITTDIHQSSGTAYWTIQGTPEVFWDMSTFTVTEAPNNAGGTVTYDVGSSEQETPVFTQTNLTQAQVQALTDLQGKYLFIRVNLSVAAPYFERAEIGNGSITTVAH